MDDDFSGNYENWIDSVRGGIYDEMQLLGKDKYNRVADLRIKEISEQFGFIIDRREPVYSAPAYLERRAGVNAVL
jgi:hypothetical protein